MDIQHHLDHANKIIVTVCTGKASHQEMVEGIGLYQREIRSDPVQRLYNELVDFRQLDAGSISTETLQRIGELSRQEDVFGVKTRLAFLVDSALVFGLTRMYMSYRSLLTTTEKEMRVFRDEEEARTWLCSGREPGDAGRNCT